MSNRGHQRERQIKKVLEEDGWVVIRAGGSLGLIDLTALKATHQTRFIEAKSDDKKYGPFNNFGPERRQALLEIAGKAGAVPELAYWPPYGELEFIPPERWP